MLRQSTPDPRQPISKIQVVHYFTDPAFFGDERHAIGVKNALQNIFKPYANRYQEKKWFASQYDEFKIYIAQQLELRAYIFGKNSFILGIGTHGLNMFSKLVHDFPSIRNHFFLVWSGHQYISGLETLAGKVNIIALPGHAITADIQALLQHSSTKIFPMIGVPHNLTQKTIAEAYEQWQRNSAVKSIPVAKKYIRVILGGDAPDANGTQLYFTPQEAKILAQYIADIAQKSDATILITNGVRTGKFDPVSGLERFVHKSGAEKDATTLAFEAVLEKNAVNFVSWDFVDKQPSAYQPILGATSNPNTPNFITGDSTSMVTEMLDMLPKGSVFVVKVDSMNNTHQRHMQAVVAAGMAHGLSIDLTSNSIQPFVVDTTSKNHASMPAAKALATEILFLQRLIAGCNFIDSEYLHELFDVIYKDVFAIHSSAEIITAIEKHTGKNSQIILQGLCYGILANILYAPKDDMGFEHMLDYINAMQVKGLLSDDYVMESPLPPEIEPERMVHAMEFFTQYSRFAKLKTKVIAISSEVVSSNSSAALRF
jgi:mitochondrial fission protein ELM1